PAHKHGSANQETIELSPAERAYVARQIAAGRDHVFLSLVAKPGKLSQLRSKLEHGSSDVFSVQEAGDYLRAKSPISDLQRVLSLPEVAAAQIELSIASSLLDGPHAQDDPLPQLFSVGSVDGQADVSKSTQNKPGTPPTAYTPRDNPYTAESETQSLQFKVR